jgi:predicted RNA-binding protein with PIN domain
MHFLIDGHNLIARMPDIDLADPDDEAKLVARLKRWASAESKRKVTVIFDAGLPGGVDRGLSNSSVSVIFAPTGVTADALLIKRIDKLRDAGAYAVVTSDQAIISVARRRKIRVLRSEEFVGVLAEERRPARPSPRATADADPQLSPNELAEWLELFGPEPETPRPTQPSVKRKKKRPAQPPAAPTEAEKEAAELAEWLRLFGYKE